MFLLLYYQIHSWETGKCRNADWCIVCNPERSQFVVKGLVSAPVSRERGALMISITPGWPSDPSLQSVSVSRHRDAISENWKEIQGPVQELHQLTMQNLIYQGETYISVPFSRHSLLDSLLMYPCRNPAAKRSPALTWCTTFWIIHHSRV